GRCPKQQRAPFEGRPQQDEIAIAADQKFFDRGVVVAGRKPFPDEQAEILGERRIAIVDRLVLADHAAQLLRESPRPGLQRWILEHLVGLHRKGEVSGPQEKGSGDGEDRGPAHGYSAAASSPRRRAGRGAPTRNLRSLSENAPPAAMTMAPSQIK